MSGLGALVAPGGVLGGRARLLRSCWAGQAPVTVGAHTLDLRQRSQMLADQARVGKRRTSRGGDGCTLGAHADDSAKGGRR